MKKLLLPSACIAAVALLGSLAVWSTIPSPMPIHWNVRGEADGFAPKALGLLLVPAVIAGLGILAAVVGRAGSMTETVRRVLGRVMTATSAFMLLVHGMVIHAALTPGHGLWMGGFMAALGILFVAIGLSMDGLEPNRWVGVRTPWTLKSEIVWRLTHRMAKKTMATGGVVAALAALLPAPLSFVLGFAAIMIGSLVPVVYSYVVHRTQKARG
jgi:uncharacterized membrane protein